MTEGGICLKTKEDEIKDIFILFSIIIAVHLLIGMNTGLYPWKNSVYNSYVLQASSWLSGRLDVDFRSWLELAEFNGKYYVSFPPFPSYIILPFAALFGENVPAGWIAAFTVIIGAYFSLRLAWNYLGTGNKAVFIAAFLYTGTNVIYITMDSSVWFIAQSMALTLTIMAVYYAVEGKGDLSLLAWACAVGCRPFQVIYLPVLLLFIYQNNIDLFNTENKRKAMCTVIKWILPVIIVARSYMALNYFRFGNILEFGHNYLPEFKAAEYGQFSINYFTDNFRTLFRLPYLESGKITFYKFNGNCIFIVSPLIVCSLAATVKSIKKLRNVERMVVLLSVVLVCLHICLLCMHRTMGGYHFGHRYINDTLPFAYLVTLICMKNCKGKNFALLFVFLYLEGLIVNIYGTITTTL